MTLNIVVSNWWMFVLAAIGLCTIGFLVVSIIIPLLLFLLTVIFEFLVENISCLLSKIIKKFSMVKEDNTGD